MKIDDLSVEKPVISAPMAGVTDFPYREILAEMGCQLIFTEMVSSKGLIYGSRKTEELVDFPPDRSYLIGVQIFGEEVDVMAEAARKIAENYQPDLIDINMGCPARKVTNSGAGAALLQEPELVAKLVRAVVKAVKIPVTVKIRSGWNQENINARLIGKIVEDNGASALTIHGRTREQYYKGKADWDIIGEIKFDLNIPVIGNGDVFSPEAAEQLQKKTGCDGVMVARGLRGNPWLIKRANHFLFTGNLLPVPEAGAIIAMAKKHLKLAVNYYGEQVAIPKMRKHLSWYVKGMPYATEIKDKINRMHKLTDINEILNNYLSDLCDINA